MKRFLIIVAILLSVVVCGALAHAEPGPKVLLIPREGYSYDLELMLTKEVGVMTRMLNEAGFEVVVATTTGRPIKAPTRTLKPDFMLAEVKLDEYAGIIMPCMAVGMYPGPPVSPEAVTIVKQAVSDGKPVAAQAGSVIILAEAGVLEGKRYAFSGNPLKTSPRRKRTDPRFTGAGTYSGLGVVQDGNVITSGVCPTIAILFPGLSDGTTKLTQTFIAELKKK